MVSNVTSHPWSSDSLFLKARLYLEQMEANTADEWQFGLWSALSLELLCRAALSHVSPILLADSKNWRNLTYALGNEPTIKKFSPTSISTSEAISRLSEVIPGITEEIADFCLLHTQKRNIELHTGEAIFAASGTSKWLPKFYQSCKVLLESMGKGLSDFIADYQQAESMINSLKDATAQSVQQDIKAHAKVWSNKSDDQKQELVLQATIWATRQTGHRVQCPSCSSPSLLQGSPSGSVSTKIDADKVIQKQSMLPATFECIACGLKILGFSKLVACELGDAFTSTTTYSAAEFFELYTEDDLEDARNEAMSFQPDFND